MTDSESPKRPWSAPPAEKGAVTQITELKDLVVGYTKQETVDPLKSLGRHLGFGLAGALLIGVGWGFGLLALLRGLQQLDFFNSAEPDGGTWSWLPYLIVGVFGTIAAAGYARIMAKRLNDDGDHP